MFNIKSGLYEHKIVHTGARSHECSICGKQYGLKGYLRHHEAQVHRKEQLYYCRICQKSFSNTTHNLTHTKEKPHKCSECDKQFSLPGNLLRHRRSHSGEKNYECPICKMRFGFADKMKRHLLTHTDERPFQCSLCNNKFKTKSDLKKHETIHRNIKPHKCINCEATFKTKSEERHHQRVHNESRPFECDKCGVRRKTRTELISHTQVHSDDKPHTCQVCLKKFKTNLGIHLHLKTMHNIRTSKKCTICNAAFNKISDLKKHITIIHFADGILKESGVSGNCDDIEIDCYLCDLCSEEFKTDTDWQEHKNADHHRLKLVTLVLDKSIQ